MFVYLFIFAFKAAPMAYGGVQSELQLLAYATATATPDLSRVCNLHHSSRQHRILNPLSKARDGTHNLVFPSWICFCCSHMLNPLHLGQNSKKSSFDNI